MPGKYVYTNIENRRGDVEQAIGQGMDVGREEPVATGRGHLHSWELFVKQRYVVLHVNPSKKVVAAMRSGDSAGLGKIWESVHLVTARHIAHLGFLSEWIDDVDSFCISFSKILSSRDIADRFVKDLDSELKRRFA